MVSYAGIVRQQKFLEETTFAAAVADWTAVGQRVHMIDPDTTGAMQAVVNNENTRQFAIGPYTPIKTLRNGSISFSAYLHSLSANAAEAGTATSEPIDKMLRVAMGGRDLGKCIGFAGGSASAPEVDSETGYVVGDWIFAYDDSASVGRFRRIWALPGADVFTLDKDLHFTPATADVAHAVVDCYLHELALTQHTHTEHKTCALYFQGQSGDDALDVLGAKLAATIEPITAGEPLKLSFEVPHARSRHEELQAVTLTGTVYGEAGLVPGQGNASITEIAQTGDPLATLLIRGSVTITLGIGWEPDSSPSGTEGVNGWVATGMGETKIEVMVDHDDAWHEAFRAETEYHFIHQVGDQPTGAVAFYAPRMVLAEEPVRVDENGLSSSKLVFLCLVDETLATGLTGTDYYKAISPIHILLAG